MIANETMAPTCNSPADLPKVHAVIAHFPALDMTRGTTDTALGRLVGQYYVGGTPRQFPDRYRAIDSASHLSDRAPPTLIFQGNRDHLVLAGPVRAFARRAEQEGVDIRYVEYPTLEHGWGDSNYPTRASGEIMAAWLRTRFRK
jgi:acetyl esterase/lipase